MKADYIRDSQGAIDYSKLWNRAKLGVDIQNATRFLYDVRYWVAREQFGRDDPGGWHIDDLLIIASEVLDEDK